MSICSPTKDLSRHVAGGRAPRGAARSGRRRAGDGARARRARGIWLDTVWQDVRYAVRVFRKAPWFTATAVASLALGIGLNSALFSAIEVAILRPLPYPDPDRLVSISQVVTTPWGLWSSGSWVPARRGRRRSAHHAPRRIGDEVHALTRDAAATPRCLTPCGPLSIAALEIVGRLHCLRG